MKKQTILVLALLALALGVLAACTTVSTLPTAAPTTAGASATPAAPATQGVTTTVQSPATTAAGAPAATSQTPVTGTVTSDALTPPVDNRPTVPAPVEGERPLADLAANERNDRFSGPAETYVKPDTIYLATIVTDKGNIVAELYQDTPESLNNFVTLALDGYYDGLTFHRVEPNFVIQGGDPTGSGTGGPGYTIPSEIKHMHPRGALAWARTGDQVNPERRSSGSQFYITLDETPFLDGAYTVFGFVVEGMDVADQIEVGDKIQRIEISEGTASRLPTPVPTATPFAPTSQEGRPLATVAVADREGYYNAPPEMIIDTGKTYEATIETDKGDIVIELDAELAPNTVNNFVTLANLGYYDAMPVAFVEPNTYMVLGSPESNPGSDVGYSLPIEADPGASDIVTGTVAMYPSQGPTGAAVASGSQFFIAFTAVPPGASPINIMGKVTEGMDIAQQLAAGDVIKTITIESR